MMTIIMMFVCKKLKYDDEFVIIGTLSDLFLFIGTMVVIKMLLDRMF